LYHCGICGLNFNKKNQLNKHNYIHTGEKLYKCYFPYCNKSYFNEGKLNSHLKKIHNNNNNNNFLNKEKEFKRSYINNTNDIKFPKEINENKSFNERSIAFSENSTICMENLDKINNTIEAEEQMQNKILSKKTNFDYHENNNNNNSINNININIKLKNKNDKLKLKCDIFSYNKIQKSYYRCPIENCLKTYTTPFNLKSHIKTFHYSIKQFQCEICLQNFKHKCSLERHFLKSGHTGKIIKNNDDKVNDRNINKNRIFDNNGNSILKNNEEEAGNKNGIINIHDLNLIKEKIYKEKENNYIFKDNDNDNGNGSDYDYDHDHDNNNNKNNKYNEEDLINFNMEKNDAHNYISFKTENKLYEDLFFDN
jgi:hypothetical protein